MLIHDDVVDVLSSALSLSADYTLQSHHLAGYRQSALEAALKSGAAKAAPLVLV